MYTQIKLYKYLFFSSQIIKLNQKYEIYRNILKCDYIRYSPGEIKTINTAISQININVPRKDSVNSLLNSYLD